MLISIKVTKDKRVITDCRHLNMRKAKHNLAFPFSKDTFHLYSDISKFAMGSALYKIQNGKQNLMAYASKRLPEAARNYSITELEMCGLAIKLLVLHIY